MEDSNRFIYDIMICISLGAWIIWFLLLIGIYEKGGEITISPTFIGKDLWIIEWFLDLIIVIGAILIILIGGIKIYYKKIK